MCFIDKESDRESVAEGKPVQVVSLVVAVGIGYILGSFPAGYLLGRLWGINVLEMGSGRTGGTNLLRSAGVVPALLTGALDMGKGALAVWLAGQVTAYPAAEVLAGAAAILGHNHSVFLRFRGGAGVGTSLGALAAIYPPAAAGLVVLLFFIVAVTRYASIASLTVATLMPLVLLALGVTGKLTLTYVLYGLLAWAIVVAAHKGNIRRLLAGTERRVGDKGQLRS
jgi:glycerol-3-phosphate acyltransferase PlsY